MRYSIILLVLIMSSTSIQAQDAEVEVQLAPGWNQISINVIPPDDMWQDIPLMFDQFRDQDGELLNFLVRDEEGRFYRSALRFNNIPFWNFQRGLLVHMDEPILAVWEGEPMEADLLITLGGVQVLLPYIPNYQLNADNEEYFVISEIIDVVDFVQDGRGEFMWLEYNFSNMNPWSPGRAYWVALNLENDEEIEFRYPEEQDDELVWFERGDRWGIPIVSRHFISILVRDIAGPDGFEPDEGDQIGAFTEDV